MARSDPQVNVRLPEALLKRLRSASESSGKTLTQEIIERLEASFPRSFDLLLLEQKQRQLSEFRKMEHDLEWLLEEEVDQLSPSELDEVRAQHARLQEAIKALLTEIDALYTESKSTSVFGS